MQQEYYIGVLPKSPIVSDDLLDIIIKKFRDFRLQVLAIADNKALGRSSHAFEEKTDRQSYLDDLNSPTDFWFACFAAPAGLDGNIFRNVSRPPRSRHDFNATVSKDDERILKEGIWVAISSAHGPLSKEAWHLPGLSDTVLSDDVESRFHLSQLYLLEEHRGVKLPGNESLFLRLCRGSFDFLQNFAYKRASRKPAYARMRGTIAPDAADTKLMDLYKKQLGYTITGWVPQVTAMLTNQARVETWPSVEDNKDFYTACRFPCFEKLCRIDENGVSIFQRSTPQGEIWAKL